MTAGSPQLGLVGFAKGLSDWLNLLANGATVIVVLGGLLVTRRYWTHISLALGRYRAFPKTLGVAGLRIPFRAHLRRTRSSLYGPAMRSDQELQWLSDQLCGENDRSLAFTLPSSELLALAGGYRRIADGLGGRALINASNVPVLGRQFDLTSDTAACLIRLADGLAVTTGESPRRLEIAHRGLVITPQALPQRATGTPAYELVVSYRRHLTAPDLATAPWRGFVDRSHADLLAVNGEETAALSAMFANGRAFDGLLPRLVESRVEIDPGSGRRRLHIALAACSYSAVVLDHYPGPAQVAADPAPILHRLPRGISVSEVSGARVGLLTLSLIPVTSDGFLLFAQRSGMAGSHEGLFGPAVNGNLELRSRSGLDVDKDCDRFGTPDPLAAMVREGREELGLAVDPDALYTVGLVDFDSPTEKGTHVLIATSMLEQSLDQVAAGIYNADLIEGRWEVGLSLLGVPLPTTQRETADVVTWLWNATELTPHATAAGLAAVMVRADIEEWSQLPEVVGVPRPAGTREVRVR